MAFYNLVGQDHSLFFLFQNFIAFYLFPIPLNLYIHFSSILRNFALRVFIEMALNLYFSQLICCISKDPMTAVRPLSWSCRFSRGQLQVLVWDQFCELGKSSNLSVPQFHHLYNGSSYFIIPRINMVTRTVSHNQISKCLTINF